MQQTYKVYNHHQVYSMYQQLDNKHEHIYITSSSTNLSYASIS